MRKILFFVIFFSSLHLFGIDNLTINLSKDPNYPEGSLKLWRGSTYPIDSHSFGNNSQGMNYFNENYWVLSREFDVKLMNDPNSFAYDVETSLKDEHVMEQLFGGDPRRWNTF
jgi:hypothetical protein